MNKKVSEIHIAQLHIGDRVISDSTGTQGYIAEIEIKSYDDEHLIAFRWDNGKYSHLNLHCLMNRVTYIGDSHD